MTKLKLGHFDGWGNEGQLILFSGDKDAIYHLELIFRDLAKGKLNEMKFNEINFIQIFHNIELKAILSSKDNGLARKGGSNSFEWILPDEKWESFAELLTIFQDGRPGHHYLDSYSKDNTEVMVSIDEYSDDWVGWKK